MGCELKERILRRDAIPKHVVIMDPRKDPTKQPALDMHRLERTAERPVATSEHIAIVKANDSTASRMKADSRGLNESICEQDICWMCSLGTMFTAFLFVSQVM